MIKEGLAAEPLGAVRASPTSSHVITRLVVVNGPELDQNLKSINRLISFENRTILVCSTTDRMKARRCDASLCRPDRPCSSAESVLFGHGGDTVSRLLGNSLLVTLLNGLTLCASLALYPFIVVRFTATDTDAFFLALTLPWLVVGPMMNAVSSVLIPILTECKILRAESVETTVSSTLTYGMIVAVIGAVIIGIVAPAILVSESRWLSPDMAARVSTATLWLLPLILFQTAICVLEAAANAFERFWLPASGLLARQLATLVTLAVTQPLLGTSSLPVSYTAGAAVNLAMLMAYSPNRWALIRPNMNLGSDTRAAIRLAAPVLASTLILQIGMVIGRLLAAQLGPGSVTALDYATRATTAVMELATSGVLIVILADWSRTQISGAAAQLQQKVGDTLRMAMFLAMPLVAVLFALRAPVIDLWLGHAGGGAQFTSVVAAAFGFFLLGLPIDIAARIYVRALLVRHSTRVLAVLSAARVGVTTILAIALLKKLGVSAIAIADSVGILLTLTGLVYFAARQLNIRAQFAHTSVVKMLLAAAAGWLSADATFDAVAQMPPLVALTAAGLAGVAGYLVVTSALGSSELAHVQRLLGRRDSR